MIGSSDETGLPIFNRIVIFTCSFVLTVALPYAWWIEFQKRGVNVSTAFLLPVFFVMGRAGCWFSLFFRNRSTAELAEEKNAFPDADEPEIDADALVYHFSNGTRPASLYVDDVNRLIHFRNCFAPRELLSSAVSWFTCSFDDLRGVHVFRYRGGESLTVVTQTGKALIPRTHKNYSEVRGFLKELKPLADPGFDTDHPMMPIVYAGAALLGLAVAFLAMPIGANEAMVGLTALAGGFVGVVVAYVIVSIFDRKLKIGLVQPIGFGVVGLLVGVVLSQLFGAAVRWEQSVILSTIAVCGVLGLCFGVFRQRRTHRRASQSANAVE